ncbi:hypothetical protein Tco_0587786 [Tanacetum coccineum]
MLSQDITENFRIQRSWNESFNRRLSVSRYKGLRKSNSKRIIVIPDKDMSHHITGYRIDKYKIGIMKQRVDLIGDGDSTNEDGDIGVSVSLGDEIFSEGKKSRGSSIGDSDNTGDGSKTAGKITVVTLVEEQMSPWKRIIKSNEKNNETIIALMPILSVEDLCCCISVSKVVSSDWSLVSAVLGQMTYPVASLTPDSARSYMMQGAPFT